MEKSISEYIYKVSGPRGHNCGYCKSKDTKITQGMWSRHLTVEDYQDLIDRGWRRSGKYCYKPLMSSTCCPMYTISCTATKFHISKSQKVCAKKMNLFLLGGECKKQKVSSSLASKEQSVCNEQVELSTSKDGTTSIPRAKKPVRPGEGADPSKPPCRKAKELRRERMVTKKSMLLQLSMGITMVVVVVKLVL